MSSVYMGITRIFLQGEKPDNMITHLHVRYLKVFFCMAPQLQDSIFIYTLYKKYSLLRRSWTDTGLVSTAKGGIVRNMLWARY
jgi:hypothetical protein